MYREEVEREEVDTEGERCPQSLLRWIHIQRVECQLMCGVSGCRGEHAPRNQHRLIRASGSHSTPQEGPTILGLAHEEPNRFHELGGVRQVHESTIEDIRVCQAKIFGVTGPQRHRCSLLGVLEELDAFPQLLLLSNHQEDCGSMLWGLPHSHRLQHHQGRRHQVRLSGHSKVFGARKEVCSHQIQSAKDGLPIIYKRIPQWRLWCILQLEIKNQDCKARHIPHREGLVGHRRRHQERLEQHEGE